MSLLEAPLMAISHGPDEAVAGLNRVLVAEDDPLYRRALERFLTGNGYEVRLVSDGLQALQEATSPGAPRLLVLDWMMPGMPGPEVCRQLREHASDRYQYALLLTAKDTTADIVAGLEAGADDYLTKPFDVYELLARVRVGARIIKLQDRLVTTQEALRFQATHDPLTGVWNRGALLELVRAEVDRCRRKLTSLSLFMIDIDHFKRVNDEYGHLVGDAVLHEVAQRLSAAVRTYDVMGRCGGEEFMVISSELTYERPYQFADRLRSTVCSSPFHTPQSAVQVSISVGGVTAQPDPSCSVEKLIHEADSALYAAKRNGRNRVEMASPERE